MSQLSAGPSTSWALNQGSSWSKESVSLPKTLEILSNTFCRINWAIAAHYMHWTTDPEWGKGRQTLSVFHIGCCAATELMKLVKLPCCSIGSSMRLETKLNTANERFAVSVAMMRTIDEECLCRWRVLSSLGWDVGGGQKIWNMWRRRPEVEGIRVAERQEWNAASTTKCIQIQSTHYIKNEKKQTFNWKPQKTFIILTRINIIMLCYY